MGKASQWQKQGAGTCCPNAHTAIDWHAEHLAKATADESQCGGCCKQIVAGGFHAVISENLANAPFWDF